MKTTKLNTDSFAFRIIEEYPNLRILSFDDTHVLAMSEKSKKAHFFYDVSDYAGCEMSFHFNLLCEVGQVYQQWFINTLEMLNYKLEVKETETDYFEIITTK